ncbi:MAG: VanW family protein [Clostridiales bacterium]|nr:VanW family protein [Clostridiales bacterium]
MPKRLLAGLFILTAILTLLIPTSYAANRKTVLYKGSVTTAYGSGSATYVYPTADVQRPNSSVERIGTLKPGSSIDIVDVLPNYVEILYGNSTGFVLRMRIDNVTAVDPAATPRYGTVVSRYFTILNSEINVKSQPHANSETLITLQAGTHLGFVDISDGWARLIFKRQYGYVNTDQLPALEMVAPTVDSASGDIPIAVYNSFYNIAENEMNLNRMENLKVGSQRMDRVMLPGESLDFNGSVGPFSARNGYLKAWSLFEGELVPSSGGGSCQISSTLYNAVLPLRGLTVLARAPHGLNGAPYLPHGVDASSGGLNFIFRNDYDFPVRIVSHVQDGALFIAIYKEMST